MTFRSFRLCAQLAEVKVRILEAKQTLEDFITAQEFSRAAELKDTITELENRRNAILQEIAASSQPVDKEVHGEKVSHRKHHHHHRHHCFSVERFSSWNKKTFLFFSRMIQRLSCGV